MKTLNHVARLVVALACGLGLAQPLDDPRDYFSRAVDDEFQVGVADESGYVKVPRKGRTTRARYSASCDTGNFATLLNYCSGMIENRVTECPSDQAVLPRWISVRDGTTSSWGPWNLASTYTCPLDVSFPAFEVEDLRRLPLRRSMAFLQPPNGRAFVGIDTIVYLIPERQKFAVTIQGYDMQVEATPAQYVWDFGDRTNLLATTDPGAPYPDQSVTHVYRTRGTYTPVLTTRWTGRYRVTGHTGWMPVTGTAQTRTTLQPLTLVAPRTHLVQDTLD